MSSLWRVEWLVESDVKHDWQSVLCQHVDGVCNVVLIELLSVSHESTVTVYCSHIVTQIDTRVDWMPLSEVTVEALKYFQANTGVWINSQYRVTENSLKCLLLNLVISWQPLDWGVHMKVVVMLTAACVRIHLVRVDGQLSLRLKVSSSAL